VSFVVLSSYTPGQKKAAVREHRGLFDSLPSLLLGRNDAVQSGLGDLESQDGLSRGLPWFALFLAKLNDSLAGFLAGLVEPAQTGEC